MTKELTATTRMVLDSVRTLVIWAVSMAIGWQNFFVLQLGGFVILLVGMMLYNDIIILPGVTTKFREIHYLNGHLTTINILST